MGLHGKITHRSSTAQEDLLIGGISGCFAAGATTPLDVIKTRMMCAASSRPSVASAAAEARKAAQAARLERQLQQQQDNFLLVEYHEGVPQPALGASLSTSHTNVGRKRL